MSKASKTRKIKAKVARKATIIEASRIRKGRARALYASTIHDEKNDPERQYHFRFIE